MSQTSYSINHGEAYEGMIADLQPKEIVSRAVETAAGIGIAVAVSRGTDAEKQVVLGADGAFFGVTVRSLDHEVNDSGNLVYDQYDAADIMRHGYIWVAVPSGCSVGDLANYADGTGVIDAGAEVGGTSTQIPGATFETAAAAGGLALLRIPSE